VRVLLTIAFAVLTAAAEVRWNVRIPMRDGVKLATNIFAPTPQGRFPALLVRTPYGKGQDLLPGYKVFIERGYAVVVQDVRGRYESEGVFRPLTQEINDGNDTIDWIAKRPWSDGRVAMLGGSYLGIAQWRAALSQNRHLVAIFPVVAGCDEYTDRFYSQGGAMKLGHRLLWLAENLRAPSHAPADFFTFVRHLPLRTADRAATGRTVEFWQEAMAHPTYDDFWRARSTRERLDTIRTPAFIVSGWYDNFVENDLDAYSRLSRQSAAHRVVIGAWGHNMATPFPSGITFGKYAGAPVRRYQLDWFDYWMKSTYPPPPFNHPPVRIFVMGLNQWRDEQEWPLKRARDRKLYLSSRAGANSLLGDGELVWTAPARDAYDTYQYDPRHPVQTAGGPICCNPRIWHWGPMDQRTVEVRDDVLVYTTEPLKRDLEVTGPVRVVLYVSTTAPDTDFTAKLVDVFPDGHARNLCDGILRLRYRETLAKAKLAETGQVYAITIPAGVTSNLFRAGHRVRLEVSSSNFPRFDRNPNTGRPVADERELRVARQTVFHGAQRASHIVLPVVPQ
jgi:putative CocE/NonD family hydrolase